MGSPLYAYPDAIVVNANLYGLLDRDRGSTALAIKNGIIISLGSDAEIEGLRGSRTETIDAKGRTVLPGINDAHIHLASWGATRPPVSLDLSYPNVKSIADVAALVAAKAVQLQEGQWIRGFGWNEEFLAECRESRGRRPSKHDLDPVSPRNPVALTDFTGGHTFWVNSLALRLAGIDGNTPDPKGGTIIRDEHGDPGGLLDEPGAVLMVAALMPPLSREEKRQAVLFSLKELSAKGVTSVTEPGLGHSVLGASATDSEVIGIYNELLDEGLLPLRVSFLMMFSDVFEGGTLTRADLVEYLRHLPFRSGFGNEWLRIAGVKLYSDSMPLNKTAWMNEPYVGGGTGSLLVTGDTDDEKRAELVAIIKEASRRRLQLGVHSIGDRAVDAVVDGFVEALTEDPWDARHYVIHADYVTPRSVELMAAHNIGVCGQSLIKWVVTEMSDQVVGEERSAREFPLATLANAGIHVADSSDAPVVYPDWKRAVWAACTRISRATGKLSGPEERLTREQAIAAWTSEPAWIDHMEHVKGSIAEGKLVDLCILDADIRTIPVDEVPEISTLMTLAGGRIVHAAPNF